MDVKNVALLGFLFVTMVTAFAVIASAVGVLPNVDPQFVKWGIPTVLGGIVGTVVLFLRVQLTHAFRFFIEFEGANVGDVILDVSKCTYTLNDASGALVKNGNIGPTTLGHQWQVEFPISIQPDQSLTLTLPTEAGDTWTVRAFKPSMQTRPAYLN